MGNSASALPYNIGDEIHKSTRPGSCGFAIHKGNRKSNNDPVTVFKGSKSAMAQTPLVKGSTKTDPSLSQIFPALHHFQKCKTLIHPNILKIYATLDTDYPNVNDGKDVTGPAHTSTVHSQSTTINTDKINPASLSALESTATTGDLIIVTEPVVPLEDYLESLQNDTSLTDTQRAHAVGYGICNIVNALSFLHNNAKVAHGNLCPTSIYVTPSGDFKLSSLFLLTPIGSVDGASGPTPHFRHFERDITPNLYRSPERIESRWDAISTSPIHVMDAYALGMLLPELYTHLGAGTQGQLPLKLEKACKRLASQSISARPRIGPLLRCPVFDTEYIKAQTFLDTLATQDVEMKINFWKKLPELLNTKKVLSPRIAKYKVLPILQSTILHLTTVDLGLTQDIHKRECLALLPTLFTTSTTFFTKEEFQSNLSPIIELLFRVNDRAVRGALLSRMNLFAKLLDPPTLNKVVFEPMCSGFSDSSPPLRELTLKSAIVLVEFLTPANLEKLTRYLVRLQSDTEDSIRTNTVIFIGKVAPNLSDMARSKLILPAFIRAMNDGFVPCRLAGLKAISACRDYFDEKNLASDVLPAIAPSLLDANEEVRRNCMLAVEELLEILRRVSDRMSEEERSRAMMEGNNHNNTVGDMSSSMGATTAVTTSTMPSTSSSSYLSGFSSWASSKISTSSSSAPTTTTAAITSTSATTPVPTTTTTTNIGATSNKTAPKFSSLSLREDAGVGGKKSTNIDYDSFDDFDNATNTKNTLRGNKNESLIPSWASENDDDDFMSQFEKKDIIRPKSAVGVGSNKLNTPSRLITSTRLREKVGVTKLAMSKNDGLDDGWEDF